MKLMSYVQYITKMKKNNKNVTHDCPSWSFINEFTITLPNM